MERPYQNLHDTDTTGTVARYAFIVAFIFGVGGGTLLKSFEVHAFVASAFSATVLFAYALTAWASGRLRLEPENIGDNCYYLGFLFTLASLAFTLYQMADPRLNDGSAVNIPSVISGFGVALSSTIVGVFLRVLLMQMRPDFVAKEREIRADMNKSFTEFKKSLSLTLRQMKAFSSESVQMAAERDERIREDTEAFVKNHQAALLSASKEFTQSLNRSLTEMAAATQQQAAIALEQAGKKSLAAIETSTAKSLAAIEDARREILQAKYELLKHEADTFEAFQQRRKSVEVLLDAEHNKLAVNAQEMEKYIDVSQRTADTISQDLVGSLEQKLLPALDALIARLDRLPAEPKSLDEESN